MCVVQCTESEDWREGLYRAYLYWVPHRNWTAGVEYQFEKFKLERRIFSDAPDHVDTMSAPLSIRYFDPSGFFVTLGATYVRQAVKLAPDPGPDHSDFVVVDSAIGYRLPKRRGILSLEARNLFDRDFRYQDDNFRTSEIRSPQFIPDRMMLARIILNF